MLRNTIGLVLGLALTGAGDSSAWAKEKEKEKPEALLFAAKKISDARPWSVLARVNTDKNMKISGVIFGQDFDLTIETADGVTRQITLGEKNWSSEDGGQTWKSSATTDRRFYYLVHTPIRSSAEEKIPPFEKVGIEKLDGASVQHIRFLAPDKVQSESDRPNYWIAVANGQPPVIHRYYGPAAFENHYVDDRVEYAPLSEKEPIVPPPGNPSAAAAPPGPERLLMTAMKKMSTGVWAVKGTATFKKTIQIHGLLQGDDFDLSMGPQTPMREIMIGGKAWICSDGKTYHAGIAEDRLVYTFTHTPIFFGRLEPAFVKVDSEPRDGGTWLHIRLQVSEAKADPKSLPQYWLMLDAHGQALYIGRAEIPLLSRGSTDVTYCAFDYAPSQEQIAPPPAELMKAAPPVAAVDADEVSIKNPLAGVPKGESAPAPLDDKIHSFQDIETHKFDWAGKVVRVEVQPKLLQAFEFSKGTFRVMLEDTSGSALSYGQVELPGTALVSLGFLKKTVAGGHGWMELEKMGALGRTEGAPVSFYVRVVPIGQKPAARCIAVGSKYLRGRETSPTYGW